MMLFYINILYYKAAAKASNIPAPINAPMIGPTTGTQAYPQFDPPFPLIGRIACAILGPKSLAGLIANPVAPPVAVPIKKISIPTKNGPIPDPIPF